MPLLLERVYNKYDLSSAIEACRHMIGLEANGQKDYINEIKQTWAERKERGEY